MPRPIPLGVDDFRSLVGNQNVKNDSGWRLVRDAEAQSNDAVEGEEIIISPLDDPPSLAQLSF